MNTTFLVATTNGNKVRNQPMVAKRSRADNISFLSPDRHTTHDIVKHKVFLCALHEAIGRYYTDSVLPSIIVRDRPTIDECWMLHRDGDESVGGVELPTMDLVLFPGCMAREQRAQMRFRRRYPLRIFRFHENQFIWPLSPRTRRFR